MSDFESMVDHALYYARERGWYVFPITPGEKNPPLITWKDGSTKDEAEIHRLWGKWPDANIGLDCEKSGLIVVDLDDKKGKEGSKEFDFLQLDHGIIPETTKVSTPSGGTHIYFRGIADSTQSKLAPGVDTRGQVGYVLLPPSIADGSDYKWETITSIVDVPDWIVELAGKKVERTHEDAADVELDTEASIAWAIKYLTEDAPTSVEGASGDTTTFVVAAVMRDRAISFEMAVDLMLEHYNDRCSPPWTPEEMRQKISNSYTYATHSQGGDSAEADFGAPVDIQVEEEDDEEEVKVTKKGQKMLGDEWIWAAQPKWFIRRDDGLRLDIASFDSKYNYMTDSGKISTRIFSMVSLMPKFMTLCYRPLEKQNQGEQFNVWRPGDLEPKEGDTSWFVDHLLYLTQGRERERDLMLDWLAHAVQKPDRKMTFALLIRSGEGAGKGWLARIMSDIMGAHNVSHLSPDNLKENFNGWVVNKQLVVANELMAIGRKDIVNKLKPMITDETIMVREMYHPPYPIENKANFIMFTNHEDAIPIDSGDRRYMVIFGPEKPKPEQYYNDLWDMIDNRGGSAAVYHLLKSRDISGFAGHYRAPETEDKEQMRRFTMGEAEEFLLDLFETSSPPFHSDLVSAQDLIDALPDRITRKVPRLGNVVGGFLRRELEATPLGQHSVAGRRQKLWAVRRAEMLEQMTAKERAKRYLQGASREFSSEGDEDDEESN